MRSSGSERETSINWTRKEYCGTTTGNQWRTENTNPLLNPKDSDLLAHRAVHFLAVSFCQIVNRLPPDGRYLPISFSKQPLIAKGKHGEAGFAARLQCVESKGSHALLRLNRCHFSRRQIRLPFCQPARKPPRDPVRLPAE